MSSLEELKQRAAEIRNRQLKSQQVEANAPSAHVQFDEQEIDFSILSEEYFRERLMEYVGKKDSVRFSHLVRLVLPKRPERVHVLMKVVKADLPEKSSNFAKQKVWQLIQLLGRTKKFEEFVRAIEFKIWIRLYLI